MYTSKAALMDLDRGILARIDRKLLASLGNDEAFRPLRVPATATKWATWKRHCDSVGISMGRAVTMLIDRELISVFGDANSDPTFSQRVTEHLAIRKADIVVRERLIASAEAQMAEWSERLQRREDELGAREQQSDAVQRDKPPASPTRAKIGRNERCPCGSGLKYKRCHGFAGRREPRR